MSNFKQSGHAISGRNPMLIPAIAGRPIVAGGYRGVAGGDAAPGSEVLLLSNGVFTLPLTVHAAVEIGATVYVSPSTLALTTNPAVPGVVTYGVLLEAFAAPVGTIAPVYVSISAPAVVGGSEAVSPPDSVAHFTTAGGLVSNVTLNTIATDGVVIPYTPVGDLPPWISVDQNGEMTFIEGGFFILRSFLGFRAPSATSNWSVSAQMFRFGQSNPLLQVHNIHQITNLTAEIGTIFGAGGGGDFIVFAGMKASIRFSRGSAGAFPVQLMSRADLIALLSPAGLPNAADRLEFTGPLLSIARIGNQGVPAL